MHKLPKNYTQLHQKKIEKNYQNEEQAAFKKNKMFLLRNLLGGKFFLVSMDLRSVDNSVDRREIWSYQLITV